MLNIDVTKPAPQTSEIETERDRLQREDKKTSKTVIISVIAFIVLISDLGILVEQNFSGKISVAIGFVTIVLLIVIASMVLMSRITDNSIRESSIRESLEDAPKESCLKIRELLHYAVISAYRDSVVIDAKREFINAEVTAMAKWVTTNDLSLQNFKIEKAYNEVYIKS